MVQSYQGYGAIVFQDSSMTAPNNLVTPITCSCPSGQTNLCSHLLTLMWLIPSFAGLHHLDLLCNSTNDSMQDLIGTLSGKFQRWHHWTNCSPLSLTGMWVSVGLPYIGPTTRSLSSLHAPMYLCSMYQHYWPTTIWTLPGCFGLPATMSLCTT